jgi:hypothetical protein
VKGESEEAEESWGKKGRIELVEEGRELTL